jgi:hypothetical protein
VDRSTHAGPLEEEDADAVLGRSAVFGRLCNCTLCNASGIIRRGG